MIEGLAKGTDEEACRPRRKLTGDLAMTSSGSERELEQEMPSDP